MVLLHYAVYNIACVIVAILSSHTLQCLNYNYSYHIKKLFVAIKKLSITSKKPLVCITKNISVILDVYCLYIAHRCLVHEIRARKAVQLLHKVQET